MGGDGPIGAATGSGARLCWNDRDGHITVSGRRLEWRSVGPEPASGRPVIVMLHEGLGSMALWRDFPDRLSAYTGLPVFAYSRAGYGASDPADLPRPTDYMTRAATLDLGQVLDSIGAARVILLGHSDGATIAAEYAGRVSDDRLAGVVVMAPHFFSEPAGLREIARARDAFETGDLARKMARYHRDAAATFYGWNDAWLSPAFRDWNVEEVIGAIRVPILAIQGREDQYGTLAQIDIITARATTKVTTLILEGCRHAPHFDCPDDILNAVKAFVSP